jgi:hypothetical protein
MDLQIRLAHDCTNADEFVVNRIQKRGVLSRLGEDWFQIKLHDGSKLFL